MSVRLKSRLLLVLETINNAYTKYLTKFCLSVLVRKSPKTLLTNLRTHKKLATISAAIFGKELAFCSPFTAFDMGAILGAGNTKY